MDTSADEHDRQPLNTPAIAMSSQLDRFCALVLDDAALQEKLRQPDDIDGFVALVLDTARHCGFSLSAEDIKAAMRERSLVLVARLDSRLSETNLPPNGWLPILASLQDCRPYVHWS